MINLDNAIQYGLPIIIDDLCKKCNCSKYNITLNNFENRDINATVYDSKEYDIILCLYYKTTCISSIIGRYHSKINSMELLSKTDKNFENKKFNSYLRNAFLYLMTYVPSIVNIVSFSVNPISTYTMYKHYNVFNSDLDEFVKKYNLSPDNFTVEDAIHFHKYFNNKHKKIKKEAELEFREMIEDYMMQGFSKKEAMEGLGFESKKQAIEFIMNSTNIASIALDFSLETVDIKNRLLTKLLSTNIKCDNEQSNSSNKSNISIKSNSNKSMKSKKRKL